MMTVVTMRFWRQRTPATTTVITTLVSLIRVNITVYTSAELNVATATSDVPTVRHFNVT